MPILTVEYSTGNAAFEDSVDEEGLVLLRVVESIHRGNTEGITKDSNGNKIGIWTLED